MKMFLQTLAVALLLIVAIPVIICVIWGDTELEENKEPDKVPNKIPDTITVWLSEEEKSVEVDFEKYVERVVASEMPDDFHKEALKAQAVAARTFAYAKVVKYETKKPTTHKKAPVCDTTHCQVYREDKVPEIIKKACRETQGELIYYDGEVIMQPLFFSSSGGQTENSEDVFTGTFPYLVSVSSPYEEEATHRNEEKEFTLKEFTARLKEAFPKLELNDIETSEIKILSRTPGGRVSEMQIGDVTLAGTQVRSALKLSSALFSISFKDSGKKIVFISNGSGHGVGMSQYGANGMAKEGCDYKEILQHYYTGTEIY